MGSLVHVDHCSMLHAGTMISYAEKYQFTVAAGYIHGIVLANTGNKQTKENVMLKEVILPVLLLSMLLVR